MKKSPLCFKLLDPPLKLVTRFEEYILGETITSQNELQEDGIDDEKLWAPCHIRNKMGNISAEDIHSGKIEALTSKI